MGENKDEMEAELSFEVTQPREWELLGRPWELILVGSCYVWPWEL